jgi:hypothetical protein
MKDSPTGNVSTLGRGLIVAALALLGASTGCGDDESDGGEGGAGGGAASSGTSPVTSSSSGTPSTTSGSSSGGSSTSSASGSSSSSSSGGGVGAGLPGSETICVATATTTDLAEMLVGATGKFEEALGEAPGPIAVWFQERIGLEESDDDTLNDLGFVAFTTALPADAATPDADLLVYRFDVNGLYAELSPGALREWEGATFDEPTYPAGDQQLDVYLSDRLYGTIASDLSEEDATAIEDEFMATFPGSSLLLLTESGDLEATQLDTMSLGAARTFLLEREGIESADIVLQGFNGSLQGNGPVVDLGDVLDDGPIDVYARYAFLGRWAREVHGSFGYTLPSLDFPYGAGYRPESRLRRYEVIAQLGCGDELLDCGFQVAMEDGRLMLTDPSYIAAAAFELGCVNLLEPEQP